MRTIIASFLSLVIFCVLEKEAFAEPCAGCKRAQAVRSLPSGVESQASSAGQVCVPVSMPDQCDTIAIEARLKNGQTTPLTFYRLGRAVAEAKSGQLQESGVGVPVCSGGEFAMVCLKKSWVQRDVEEVVLIPGNQGTCHRLTRKDLDALLHSGSFPNEQARRLGWSAVGSSKAPGK